MRVEITNEKKYYEEAYFAEAVEDYNKVAVKIEEIISEQGYTSGKLCFWQDDNENSCDYILFRTWDTDEDDVVSVQVISMSLFLREEDAGFVGKACICADVHHLVISPIHTTLY